MRVLIIGCGYSGLVLGARLVSRGHEVFGMRRSGTAADELMGRGIIPIHADITEPASLSKIAPEFDAVVNLASSTRGGLEEYRAVYLEGTRHILDWLRFNPPGRYIHVSSTSVYPQNDGSVVTEESPAEPVSETSKVLRETENVLSDTHAKSGFPAIILRASGIYGPERGHLFKQYLRDEAVLREDGSNFINMVHVEDVAGAIEYCLAHGGAEEIYNLSDDEPVTQLDFFSWLSKELDKPLPPSAPANPERKRGLSNKRVSNRKLKRETGYQFVYPTFREGYEGELKKIRLRRGGH